MNTLVKYLLSFKLLFMIVGGFVFYLLSAIIDPIFIPTLEMPRIWCQKWVEKSTGYQTEEICVEFNSKLNELKYNHNRKMEKRRHYKMIGFFLAASVLTFLLMVFNPSLFFGEAVTIEDYTGAIAIAVFYGVILGFILPTVYELLLPPPMEWLPQELLEIRNARTEFILKEIVKMSEKG